MILTYREFINEQLNVREQLNGICQGDNLPVYKWDTGSVNPKEFDSIFRVEEITDSTLQRMKGKSYPENCEIAVDDLRYLIIPHYDGNGAIRIGELICNKKVSGAFIYLFKELFKNKFPIERMELVDNYDGDDHRSMEVNNTSSFNYRFVKGTDELSRHAFGMAIDINPLYNPCVRETGVSPKEGEAYADRTIPIKYMLHRGDIVYKILHDKFGFTWGADFENCIKLHRLSTLREKIKNNYYFDRNFQKYLEVSFFYIIFVSRNKNNNRYEHSGDLFSIERKAFIPRLV